MGVFIFTEEVAESLRNLREHAEANPYTTEMLETIISTGSGIPGDIDGFYRYIPVGIKTVFTIELQEAGTVRHLSVSTGQKGKMPPPYVVETVMETLGFENLLYDCLLWTEEVAPGHHAINVLEKIKEK